MRQRGYRSRLVIFFMTLFLCVLPRPAHATAVPPALYDAFVNSQMSGNRSGVFFVDARSGLSSVAVTNGYNHTILGSSVIFREKSTNEIRLAKPDGTIERHPFIEASDLLIWVVSPNRGWVVWTSGQLQAGSLISSLNIARADGTDRQIALRTSSSKLLGVRPVAVSNDGKQILYTRQIDDPKAYRVYPAYDDLYRLNVETGASEHIPDEPRCTCAAVLSVDGRVVFRLEANESGYASHWIDLSVPGKPIDLRAEPISGTATSSFNGFKQSGEAILNERGNLAVYALARGNVARELYAVVVADLTTRTQRLLVDVSVNRLRPIALQGDSLILAGWDKDGTYKISLDGGALTQISTYTYLGTFGN